MSRGKWIVGFSICLFLFLSSFTWLYPAKTEYVRNIEDTTRLMSLSDYTLHDPIRIMNDTALGFYAVSGNGNSGNPYILEGWNITTKEDDSIIIHGTTKHFILRDCWLSGSTTGSDRGIWMTSVASGTAVIENIHCESWYIGIEVSSTPETLVKDCSIQDCQYGLMMSSSSNSTIFNNTVFKNDAWGMYISSPSTTVANNTLWGNAHGLEVYYAYNMTLENNTMSDDGFHFLFDTIAGYVTIKEQNNLVNGLPLALLINEVGTSYGGGIGQAVLINCTNIKLTDQNLSHAETGAYLRWCTNCRILDSHLDHNDDSGLYVSYSDSITIESTTASGNVLNGFLLTHSNVNITNCDINENRHGLDSVGTGGTVSIQNNRFVNNTDYGLPLNGQWNVSITGNTFTDDGVYCSSYAAKDYASYSNNVTGNLVNGKPLVFYNSLHNVTISDLHGQIYLFNSTNVVVAYQDCSHTAVGVGIAYSSDCSVVDSDCSFAKQVGVSIFRSNMTLVQNVTCEYAKGKGISATDIRNASLIDNRCNFCFDGISVIFSQAVLLKGNVLTHEAYAGLRIMDSVGVEIYSNTCDFNSNNGIYVRTSSELIFINNTCNWGGAYGMYLEECVDLFLHSNDFEMNSFIGLSLETAWSCIIALNRFVGNGLFGLYSLGAFDSDIIWNTILSNGNHGIMLSAVNTRLMHNTIALNDGYGAYITNSLNVSTFYNMFVSNNGGGIQGYDGSSSENLWYDPISAIGNYWSDWNGDGPYYIDGRAGSCDIYPLGETDTDSDTLPDSWEIAHGLNPYSADSDGDSLPDAWEVMYGLNPLSNDTAGDHDDDGLSNLEEYLLGLNPSSDDSDGDQMPDLWEVQNYLNPLFNDAGLDPDGDDISNLYEYYGGTNPHVYDGTTITTTVTITVTDGVPDYTILMSVSAVGGFSIAIVLVIVSQMISRRRSAG